MTRRSDRVEALLPAVRRALDGREWEKTAWVHAQVGGTLTDVYTALDVLCVYGEAERDRGLWRLVRPDEFHHH